MAMFSEACLAATGEATNQDKIKYLKRFSILDKEIDRKIEELGYWRTQMGRVTSVYSAMPKGGGTIYGKTEEIVAKIVDLEAEINADIDRLLGIRREITDTIAIIKDPRERLLLQYRYIDGLTFEEIAVLMNYSWRHIHRLHSQALSNLNLS